MRVYRVSGMDAACGSESWGDPGEWVVPGSSMASSGNTRIGEYEEDEVSYVTPSVQKQNERIDGKTRQQLIQQQSYFLGTLTLAEQENVDELLAYLRQDPSEWIHDEVGVPDVPDHMRDALEFLWGIDMSTLNADEEELLDKFHLERKQATIKASIEGSLSKVAKLHKQSIPMEKQIQLQEIIEELKRGEYLMAEVAAAYGIGYSLLRKRCKRAGFSLRDWNYEKEWYGHFERNIAIIRDEPWDEIEKRWPSAYPSRRVRVRKEAVKFLQYYVSAGLLDENDPVVLDKLKGKSTNVKITYHPKEEPLERSSNSPMIQYINSIAKAKAEAIID